MHKTVLAASAVFIALSAPAFAQAVVVDPSVTSSTTVELPGEVRTYVLERPIPSVAYEGPSLSDSLYQTRSSFIWSRGTPTMPILSSMSGA